MLLFLNYRSFGEQPHLYDQPSDVAQEFISIVSIAAELGIETK